MGVCAGPAQSLLPSKPRPPSQRWKTSFCVRFCMRGQSLLHCIMPIRCGRLVLGRHAILDTILCMVRSCHCVAVLGPLIPPLALLHFKKKTPRAARVPLDWLPPERGRPRPHWSCRRAACWVGRPPIHWWPPIPAPLQPAAANHTRRGGTTACRFGATGCEETLARGIVYSSMLSTG